MRGGFLISDLGISYSIIPETDTGRPSSLWEQTLEA